MDTEKDTIMFKNMIFAIFPLLLPSTGLAVSQTVSPSLLDAIRQVESSGNRHAVGDGGKAVGAYQLHKVYVDDVNRILGKKTYTYDDRTNEAKSREMTRIYLTHYAKLYKLKDPIQISRLHNGGSTGHKKQATLKYAQKIRKVMK